MQIEAGRTIGSHVEARGVLCLQVAGYQFGNFKAVSLWVRTLEVNLGWLGWRLQMAGYQFKILTVDSHWVSGFRVWKRQVSKLGVLGFLGHWVWCLEVGILQVGGVCGGFVVGSLKVKISFLLCILYVFLFFISVQSL
uniref:Uncharacterized protein n=1 Tax=Pyxicephalus adspersus TaxID=30357 RepID=A0AAV3ALH9_PYXAD|nr:TPA: hypothetical protein GDO54_011542 [Pyxicephalus adspersus]